MNLSEISQRLSDTITEELDYSDEKKEIVAFGLESLFLSIVGFFAILLVAFFFDALIPTAISAVFGGLLRKVSGGAHMNTPLKCLTFGAVIYSTLGVITQKLIQHNLYNFHIAFILLFMSLLIVAFLAPVDCEAKPIISQKLKKNLKIISVGFVTFAIAVIFFCNNQLLNTSVVLGIGYQTLTLLPVFNKKKKEG
ncbi:MAG: accessory gene regulator B family protein [Peptococcaceae bacterium]|nr:accessory gene regulator B family protein [Peptococcaceae bacterium]